jgi:hemerythrin-like metal-binding protein
MTIPWRAEYSVGVKEIDEQHQHFIGLLNDLHEYAGDESLGAQMPAIIEALVEYAKHHFETEEKYFDEFSYEGAAEHKEKHRELMAQVEEFHRQFKQGDLDVNKLVAFLEHWLKEHLIKEDQKFAACFREHGLK